MYALERCAKRKTLEKKGMKSRTKLPNTGTITKAVPAYICTVPYKVLLGAFWPSKIDRIDIFRCLLKMTKLRLSESR